MQSHTHPLEQFQDAKDRIDSVLGNIASVFGRLESPTRASDFKACQSKLLSEQFHVAVAGAKKYGKSTLLNAILGDHVLPSKPMMTCTDVPIRVQYGLPRRAECHWADGAQPLCLDLEKNPRALYDHATPDENDSTASKYSHIDVHWPAAVCSRNVVLIDTPGFNDGGQRGKRRHDDAWASIEKHADAALVVLSCMQFDTDTDSDIIEKLLSEVIDKDSMFVAVNQLDVLRARCPDPADMQSAMKRARAKIADFGVSPDRVFFVSAIEALDGRSNHTPELTDNSGVPELETVMYDFLVQHRSKAKLLGSIAIGEHGIREALHMVQTRQDAYPAEMLRAGQTACEKAKQATREADEAKSRASRKLDEATKEACRDAADSLSSLIESLCDGLEEALGNVDISNSDAVWNRKDAAEQLVDRATEWCTAQTESWQNSTLSDLLQTHSVDVKHELDAIISGLRFHRDDLAETVKRLKAEESSASSSEANGTHTPGTNRTTGIYPMRTAPVADLSLSSGIMPGAIAGGLTGVALTLTLASHLVFPPIAALTVIGAVFGFNTAASRLRERIAEKLAEAIRDNHVSMKSDTRTWIRGRLSSRCQPAQTETAKIASDIHDLARTIQSTVERHNREADELRTHCDRMRSQLQDSLHELTIVRASLDPKCTPEHLADLIAKRMSPDGSVVEPKPAESTHDMLGYYLSVLEDDARTRLTNVLDMLKRLGKWRGDCGLRIAELWSHVPPGSTKKGKNPDKERSAYRIICVMAVAEEMQRLPDSKTVAAWTSSSHVRQNLTAISEAVAPDDPVYFTGDVHPESPKSLTAIPPDTFRARCVRGIERAGVKTAEQAVRADTIFRATDVPPTKAPET